MQSTENAISDKDRAYRRRLAAKGHHQLVVALPRETVAFLDELKERQGLRNRSQAVGATDRTGEGSRPAVIDLETRKPALPGGLSKLVTGLCRLPSGYIAAPNLAKRRRSCQTEIAVSVNGGGLPVAIQPERGITMAQENCAQGAPRGRLCPRSDRLPAHDAGAAEGRPHGGRFCRPAGGGRRRPGSCSPP